jgi:hypothetical protein
MLDFSFDTVGGAYIRTYLFPFTARINQVELRIIVSKVIQLLL